jgi:hypothetical protein
LIASVTRSPIRLWKYHVGWNGDGLAPPSWKQVNARAVCPGVFVAPAMIVQKTLEFHKLDFRALSSYRPNVAIERLQFIAKPQHFALRQVEFPQYGYDILTLGIVEREGVCRSQRVADLDVECFVLVAGHYVRIAAVSTPSKAASLPPKVRVTTSGLKAS